MSSRQADTFRATKIVNLELSQALPSFNDLQRYGHVRALVRWHGVPVGEITVPVEDARVEPVALAEAIADNLRSAVLTTLVSAALERAPIATSVSLDSLLAQPPTDQPRPSLRVSVAICTRDRPDDLRDCLRAIEGQAVGPDEVVVVDNAPSSEQTAALVRTCFPKVRYVRELRPGLDWARNRAIMETSGDVLAFTDDDVIVDGAWTSAIAAAFASNPTVDALTGLVLPAELDTEAQWLFERYGGFGRGFVRRVYRVTPRSVREAARRHGGTGKFGTGANMAFKRTFLERIGGFDPALDVGTPTNGGGDLEMFFRVIAEGGTLVYEPCALVRHRHRRSRKALRWQIANNGTGFYSHLVRSGRVYPEARRTLATLGLWWFWWWNVRRPLRALMGRGRLPLDLYVAEIIGSVKGLWRYPRAARLSAMVAGDYPHAPSVPLPASPSHTHGSAGPERVAVRSVDIAEPIRPLDDISDYDAVRLYVFQRSNPLGSIEVPTSRTAMSAVDVRDAAARATWYWLVTRGVEIGSRRRPLVQALNRTLSPTPAAKRPPALPPHESVSVVVATRDRPNDLQRCLASLVRQRRCRSVEIIVVDNNPSSGLTPAVTAGFPAVRLVAEPRHGLSYARNAGILRSRGRIIVSTDDDVVVPEEWIERLVAPFAHDDVMVVTGNVFPQALDDVAQRRFEAYGGLSRGFERIEFDGARMRRCRRAIPTWRLGSTANAAFRASIFADPCIGLIDEALGAGMPSGCSEDTYVFYKVLKAGYRIVYEPSAYAWHRHRTSSAAFRRQLFNYSKGHVAYHLTTLIRDHDARAVIRLAIDLPMAHASRVYHRLRGWTDYPVTLVLLEVIGNLVGPWALWQSRRRVRRFGPSGPLLEQSVDRDGVTMGQVRGRASGE